MRGKTLIKRGSRLERRAASYRVVSCVKVEFGQSRKMRAWEFPCGCVTCPLRIYVCGGCGSTRGCRGVHGREKEPAAGASNYAIRVHNPNLSQRRLIKSKHPGVWLIFISFRRVEPGLPRTRTRTRTQPQPQPRNPLLAAATLICKSNPLR